MQTQSLLTGLLIQGRQVGLPARQCQNPVATGLEQPPVSGTWRAALASESAAVLRNTMT